MDTTPNNIWGTIPALQVAEITTSIEVLAKIHETTPSKEEVEAINRAKSALNLAYARTTAELFKAGKLITPEEALFINFGFLDESLIGEKFEEVRNVMQKLSEKTQGNPQFNLYFLTEWMQRIVKNESVTTSFMNQGPRERAEIKKSAFDRNSAISLELDILKEIRKSCSVRGGVPGGLPILLGEKLDQRIENVFNTKEGVNKEISRIKELVPCLFINERKKTFYKIFFIIFAGIGHGMAYTLGNEGRIFIPLVNPPTGISANSTQSEISMLTSIGSMYWSFLTSMDSFKDAMDSLSGKFYTWWTKQGGKGFVDRHFCDNFIIYMTHELNGIQKLDKNLRELFWRHIPYNKETREMLAGRASTYRNLLKQFEKEYAKKDC